MEENILISIIVPVYNVNGYLEKCVESIINQSYPAIEVILVDDGSTDGSSDICDRYLRKDRRVRVIHKSNGGLVSARKAGAKIATGRYIVNVDGDDWIDEKRIENMVAGTVTTDADMIYMAGLYKEFSYGSVYYLAFPFPYGIYKKEEIRDVLISGLIDTNVFFRRNIAPSLWSWGIKTELFQEIEAGVDDEMIFGEDFVCLVSCLMKSNLIVCIDEPGYHYVKTRTDSIIQCNDPKKKRLDIYVRKMREFSVKYDIVPHMKEIMSQYIFHAIFSIQYGVDWFDNSQFLFPYSKVKNGSRIVVYGAGNVGKNLVSYLANDMRYPLVKWVDSNVTDDKIINDITVIPDEQYDYILLAILEFKIVCEIERNLLQKGIVKEKIQHMDEKLLVWENIPVWL